MATDAYRRLTSEEKEGCFDEYYDVLIGPDCFECMLGEREDRTWGRDGRAAVERLNQQHDEIKRLRNRIDDLTSIGADGYAAAAKKLISENERLRLQLAESNARAEYLDHQVGCTLPCSECERLERKLEAAAKAASTTETGT